MAEETRVKGVVKYQKKIATHTPDAYAEITLKFDGLMESRVMELREMFNNFFSFFAGIVNEDTGLYV